MSTAKKRQKRKRQPELPAIPPPGGLPDLKKLYPSYDEASYERSHP